MDGKIIKAGALASLIAIGGLATTVTAQTAGTASGMTAEQAMAIALGEVPGTVQDVEREREDGMTLFEVEVLTAEGEVMEIEIDAENGAIIAVAAEGDEKDCDDDEEDDDDEA